LHFCQIKSHFFLIPFLICFDLSYSSGLLSKGYLSNTACIIYHKVKGIVKQIIALFLKIFKIFLKFFKNAVSLDFKGILCYNNDEKTIERNEK